MREIKIGEGVVYVDDSPKLSLGIPAPKYTQLEFMTALGNQVMLEIIAAAKTEPVIELIDRQFQAASVIDTGDQRTIDALVVLKASPLVNSFDEAARAALCEPR